MKKLTIALFLYTFLSSMTSIYSQNYVWIKELGGSQQFPISTCNPVLDAEGNMYIVGVMYSNINTAIDFDPSANTAFLPPLSNGITHGAFLAKYNTNGDLVYVKKIMEGGNVSGNVNSIAIDNHGDIVITGNNDGIVVFGNSPNTATVNEPSPFIFFSKYDKDGNFIWVKSLKLSSSYPVGKPIIKTNSLNQLYLVFSMDASQQITLDLDPSPNIANASSTGSDIDRGGQTSNTFFAKYDENGNYLWGHGLGIEIFNNAPSIDRTYDNMVRVDEAGDLYLLGAFAGIKDFDPSLDSAKLISTSNLGNLVFAKYTTDGNYLYAKRLDLGVSFVNYNEIAFYAIQIDKNKNVYISGDFVGNVDFDPSPSTNSLMNSSQRDKFLAKYDMNGNFLYVKKFNWYENGAGQVSTLLLDNVTNIYLINYCGSTCPDLDTGSGVVQFSASDCNNGSKGFIAKYSSNGDFISVDNACNAFYNKAILKDNNIYFIGMSGVNSSFPTAMGAVSAPSQSFFIGKYATGAVSSNNVQIRNLSPITAPNKGETIITIEGSGFANVSSIKLVKNASPDILPSAPINLISANKIEVKFDLTGVSPNMYDLVAVIDGNTLTLPNAFEIQEISLNSLSPSIVANSSLEVTMDFLGKNFKNINSLKLTKIGQPDLLPVSPITLLSPTRMQAKFNFTGKAVGKYTIVADINGIIVTLPDTLEVIANRLTPEKAFNLIEQDILIYNTNLSPNITSVLLRRAGEEDITAMNFELRNEVLRARFPLLSQNTITTQWQVIVKEGTVEIPLPQAIFEIFPNVTAFSPKIISNIFSSVISIIYQDNSALLLSNIKLSKQGQTDIISNRPQIAANHTLEYNINPNRNISVGNYGLAIQIFGKEYRFKDSVEITGAKISSISPNIGRNNSENTRVVLVGNNFFAIDAIKLQKAGEADIEASNIIGSGTNIAFNLNLKDRKIGKWDIVISSVGIQTVFKEVFTITEPIAYDLYPKNGGDIGEVTVNLYGKEFVQGMSLKLSKVGANDIIIPDTAIIVLSPERIIARLNLKNKPLGKYDVSGLLNQTEKFRITEGFEIVKGKRAEVSVQILGGTFNRGGLQRYTILYFNKGNVDAIGVPIWLAVPQNSIVEFEFPISKIDSIKSNKLPLSFTSVGNRDIGTNVAIYGFLLPIVAANDVGILNIKAAFRDNISTIVAWANIPLQNDSNLTGGRVEEGGQLATIEGCAAAALTALAQNGTELVLKSFVKNGVADCVTGFRKVVSNVSSSEIKKAFGVAESRGAVAQSILLDMASTVLSCSELAPNPAIATTAKVLNTMLGVYQGIQNVKDVAEACGGSKGFSPPANASRLNVRLVGSLDPNDKIGLRGLGEDNYVTAEAVTFPYLIRFENIATATAPAYEVIILDTLDAQVFDLESMQFGFVSFGDTIRNLVPGLQDFSLDVDLRPTKNEIVRIKGNLDKPRGILKWTFTSLDPMTLQTVTDPLAGFLPPNINAPQGEGSVFFTIRLKQNLPTGTEIKNKASIYFDTNDAIVTPIWKNKIDITPPVSQVGALAREQSNTSFLVKWGGTDQGAGILNYSVYVSENDGAYQPWLLTTTETSAIFAGEDGKTYRFYSVATDKAFNVENIPTQADALTRVNIPFFAPQDITAKAGSQQVLLSWNVVQGAVSYEIYMFSINQPQTFIGSSKEAKFLVTGLTNGSTYIFRVKAIKANGESSEFSVSVEARPSVVLSFTDQQSGENVMIYPNPNTGNFNLQIESIHSKKLSISIFTMSGVEIMNKTIPIQGSLFNETIQLDDIAAGVYLIKIVTDKISYTEKLLIQK